MTADGGGAGRMTLARRAGGVLAGVLVAAFLGWGVAGGWSKAADYPWRLDWPLAALAVLALIGFNLAWGWGYVQLVEAVGGRGDRRRLMSVWGRSLLGRYVPGNVVMFLGRAVLGREAGVPAKFSLAASVYEQLAMLAPAALGATIFLLVSNRSGWSPFFWLVVLVPFGALLLDPAVIRRVSTRILRRLGRSVTLQPLSRGQVALVFGWFTLTMGLLALGAGLAVRAVAGSNAGGVGYLGFGFLLAWVISMVAFVFPSGIGVREGAFAVILSRHLPGPAAVSLAAASRLLLTAVELVVIAAVVAAGRLRPDWPTRAPRQRRRFAGGG